MAERKKQYPKKQYSKKEKSSWFNGIRYGLINPGASRSYLRQHTAGGKYQVPDERKSSFDADEFFEAALRRTYGDSK